MDIRLLHTLLGLLFLAFCVPVTLAQFRVTNLKLEPIIYVEGPQIAPNTHAYLSYDILPGTGLEYFNAVFNPPGFDDVWLVRNVPIPPVVDTQRVSCVIHIEVFPPFELLTCTYTVSTVWYTNPSFISATTVDLIPIPLEYHVRSGSDDPAITIGNFIPPIWPPVPPPPLFPVNSFRGCSIPNIDLDYSEFYPPDNPIPDDYNACGPAAAANSLHWLVTEPELAGLDSTSLREKLDLLKEFMRMAKDDADGVRFDSFVVGKLALIDSLKLPIRVKYQTVHASGNTAKPLASTDPRYGHAADNQGAADTYPDFDWISQEFEAREDVEIHVGWYGPPDADGVRPRHGGHWLVATGYFQGGPARGLFLKDDPNQATADQDALRHTYYPWDTLPGGKPFLRGLVTEDGDIAIVESAVSESPDEHIRFDDIRKYKWEFRKIQYNPNSLMSAPDQAWLKFQLPAQPDLTIFNFFNARICNLLTGEEVWMFQNIPFPPTQSGFPVRLKMSLSPFLENGTLPNILVMKYHIGDFQTESTFPVQSSFTLTDSLPPEGYSVSNGASRQVLTGPPFSPLLPVNHLLPFDIDYEIRGCEVPNVDLDASAYPYDPEDPSITDSGACGPAAAANSLMWLEQENDSIEIPGDIRAVLDSLKKRMRLNAWSDPDPNVEDSTGVLEMDMIRGKLEFIDQHRLPIRVKYQSDLLTGSIHSPDSTYGHFAENQNSTHPGSADFEWLRQELENDEDVEMSFGYYCENEDGTIERRAGHVINVTGYVRIDSTCFILYKDDPDQDNPGGTTHAEGEEITSFARWVRDTAGIPHLLDTLVYTIDGDTCRLRVETVISESFDSTLSFCPKWICEPNDSLFRKAVECAEDGDTIRLCAALANDTIFLDTTVLIDKNLTIIADGRVSFSGVITSRTFEVSPGAEVVMEGFNIIGGTANKGSGMRNAGDLTLRDIMIYPPAISEAGKNLLENRSQGAITIEGSTNIMLHE